MTSCTYCISLSLYLRTPIFLSQVHRSQRKNVENADLSLKGQCHDIFCFRFFSWITSPKPLIITLGSFQIFSKIRGDICKSRCTTEVNAPVANLPPVQCRRYQRNRRQIFPPVPLVLLTPAANLPPVSLTPVANNWNNIRLQTPESELEAKIYIYVSSTTQRWPNKIIKIFLIEDFLHLSCKYLREFSKKFETVLMEDSGAGGKLIHEKNQKQKISWHCPFKSPGYILPFRGGEEQPMRSGNRDSIKKRSKFQPKTIPEFKCTRSTWMC